MTTLALGEEPNTLCEFDLMRLPTELHLHISSYLSYPDALALKHTCHHFYTLVYTGVHLKVDWLVERFERKLECPMEKCSFRTDESFCNWRIRRIMERRRRHLECPRERGGCLVIQGRTCQVDLVPAWLKRQGRLELVQSVGYEVFIHGLIFLCVYFLWNLGVRYLGVPVTDDIMNPPISADYTY
ncbi:uncharacterized protein ATNIH1004_000609 [Aspergillus tanneri]|uniref:F-box domain-containing protein n=1 Tax=Aspergillus tanneri TaxID=1220188 RepID=A0A5M9N3E5_9EURO|nr:uncharacterized protein ATNIH1004_000609 [Aspergillus tanneri]KAA8651713.1 hypothetical protein ATNIH1004_000609 [Aspergillus tanneri]